MGKELTTAFDYGSVDKDAKGKLIVLSGQIKRGKANYAKSVLELGCAVHEAHELLAGTGRDGKFRAWVEGECGLEIRTAYNYLYSFEAFNKLETVASFSAGAMYALAAPTCPEKARKEAIKRAEKGERISKGVADDIIESFTVADEPKQDSKPQASVTGSAKTLTSAPPDLPSVGTVNRTDTGSQDSGDAGECPHGGPHDFVEGACLKCCEPDPEMKNGPLDFPTAVLDKQLAAAKDGKLDLTGLQAKYDAMLNCITQIKKLWNEVTGDERDGVYVVQKRQRVLTLLDELRPPIAQARPMKVCTFCKGKGCEKCSGCGWWPRSVVEGLSR